MTALTPEMIKEIRVIADEMTKSSKQGSGMNAQTIISSVALAVLIFAYNKIDAIDQSVQDNTIEVKEMAVEIAGLETRLKNVEEAIKAR